MHPIGHLIASVAILTAVSTATRAAAEPRHHGHHGTDCAELTFDHGRLRLDPARCGHHGRPRHDRDDDHWGADAVLFDHSGFRGAALELRHDIPDLAAYGFDDRASSVIVRRGRWEGCTEPGYRGRCWRVSDDEGGFEAAANNRIRSVRRVR